MMNNNDEMRDEYNEEGRLGVWERRYRSLGPGVLQAQVLHA